MSFYATSLTPSNHPIVNHCSDDGHFFTCTIQLGLRSPKNDRITDYPGPSSAEFPLHELNRHPDPSSPSWKAVAELISSVKKWRLSIGDDIIIHWDPNPVDENPNLIQLDNQEKLFGHVLAAARELVAHHPKGKKPSSLCLKISKVVKKPVWKFMLEWIKPRMKPFNSLYEDFKGIFSKDVEAARRKCRRLCQAMYRDFGVAVPDEQGLEWVFVDLREWERKLR